MPSHTPTEEDEDETQDGRSSFWVVVEEPGSCLYKEVLWVRTGKDLASSSRVVMIGWGPFNLPAMKSRHEQVAAESTNQRPCLISTGIP